MTAIFDRVMASDTVEGLSPATARLLFGDISESDTSLADYVWLPFRWDGEMAYLDWRAEWRVEDFE
ncbi:MAG: hypothetical protein ABWX92_03800 [Mycetocola sp.]